MLEAITIAGINVYNGSLNSLLLATKKELAGKQPISILTINPEIVVQAQDNLTLREILNRAWVGIPDGIGILWAARMQKKVVAERITGVRLTQELLNLANKQQLTVGVIGGTEKTSMIYQRYLKPLIQDSWTSPGPWLESINSQEVKNELTDWINTPDGEEFSKKLKKTNILFVAMGAPKQEYFIDFIINSHLATPKNLISIAVGGTFDELSGIVKKTPKWIEKIGMKWLHRLVMEPWRLRRQRRLLKFVQLITHSSNLR